jgi:hypothetical protein
VHQAYPAPGEQSIERGTLRRVPGQVSAHEVATPGAPVMPGRI